MALNEYITRKAGDSFQPAWVVAFVRYKNPATFSPRVKKVSDYGETKEVMVIENDCIAANVSSSKSNHLKSCNLTMK